jgi:Trypsin-like peptidase domain
MSRVSEDARNCVVFLGWDAGNAADPAEIRPEGTGFLIHAGEGGYRGVYLVTAAHVARSLGSDPFVVRQNDQGGAARLHHVDNAVWYYHDDLGVDVAIMRYEGPAWITSAQILPVGEFLDPARASHWDIGPGDSAYLVGLFYLRHGKRRNLPIVHAGQIAMVPSDDPIPVPRGDGSGITDDVSAYLVEIHALGGASGSPVMIRPTLRHIAEDERDGNPSLVLAEGRDFLLGVWVAAWPSPSAIASGVLGGGKWVPTGIGLVIPCDRIIEILQRSDLIMERRQAMAKNNAAQAPVPTRVSAPATNEAEDANPDHLEDFTRLVSAASKRKPKGDRT